MMTLIWIQLFAEVIELITEAKLADAEKLFQTNKKHVPLTFLFHAVIFLFFFFVL